jgi:hypothetical protein
MALFGCFKNTSREIDVLRHDVGIFKNLINERQHPLDLVRELLSNAAASQVGATRIEIAYTRDRQGHVFEVSDDGCGMDFSDDPERIGRLDRFLGLGLSSIAGVRSDEFSWKGLGSKLAYQSRRVMIETRAEGHPLYEVRIDEPWSTLKRNQVPRPRITEHKDPAYPTGTRIRVLGHPPHRQDEPFTRDEIHSFLLHRTFTGFTSRRADPPRILLSVLGRIERLDFGWPEFRGLSFPDWLQLDRSRKTLIVHTSLQRPPSMNVTLKGFLTWEPERFGLADERLNTGLLLSSRGIPYFELPMAEYGAGRLERCPGRGRVCLVAECDALYSQMNLSRSGLVDSAETLEFKEVLRQLFDHLAGSDEYRAFRELKSASWRAERAAQLVAARRTIGSDEQNWVVLERDGAEPLVLMREPKNEAEVVAILGKLESLGALPFARFQTVAHPKHARNLGLFVQFQEETEAEPVSIAMFQAEKKFRSRKRRVAVETELPNVICWDAPAPGRSARLVRTPKKYKFLAQFDGAQFPVYVLRLMDGLNVQSARELRRRGVRI